MSRGPEKSPRRLKPSPKTLPAKPGLGRREPARGRQSVPESVIYGRNPVREALRAGKRPIRAVWAAPGRATDEATELLRRQGRAPGTEPPALRTATFEELDLIAGSSEHQGLVAEVGPYEYVEPEGLLASRNLLVALDRVQDPHNLGAVIRTADASGAGVVIPRHRSAEVTAAVVKASAGASEHVPVSQVRNLADFLGEAKQRGFWIYGAAADADALYHQQDYRGPVVFVLGSEGEGLGRRVAGACDVLVSLPLLGRVESLNVSVTAGVLLFEALRQRGPSAS